MHYRELNEHLVSRIEDVCTHLFPSGKRKGSKWHFGDISGADGESSSIVLSGHAIGSWADWATGDKGNNLVSLWCASRCGQDFPKAIGEIKDYLGIKDEFRLHAPEKQYCRPTAKEKSAVRAIDLRGRVMKYLQDERGLTKETLGKFKVCADSTDSKYVFPYYDEEGVTMFKSVMLDRENGKKSMFSTRDAKPVLFGKPTIQPSDSYVIITEGEIDSMSWSQFGHPSVSIPQGAKNLNWVENDWEWLDRFETIYLSFDSDDAGKSGAKELANRLGLERCMNIDLGSYKDANEMLLDGCHNPEAFMLEAKVMMPDDVESFSSGWDDVVYEMTEAVKNPEGIKTPWPDLKWRIRPKEVTAIVGFTGHGKTTVVNQLAVHLQSAGWGGLIASLESKVTGMKAGLVRTACGEYSPPIDKIRRAKDSSLFKNLFIVNRKQDREVDAEKIYEYFRLCARKYGTKYAILDNMMMCKVKGDDLEAQKQFVEKLQRLAVDTGMHIFLVVHPRKPPSDAELSRPPSLYEAKGAGEIVNLVNNFLSVWRNVKKHMEVGKLKKDQERDGGLSSRLLDLQKKPDGCIELQKQRDGVGIEHGWIGRADTWQRGKCQLVCEEDGKTINYIDMADLETAF